MYAPLLTGVELTIVGHPWLLLSQPIAMVILGTAFVMATYYVERRAVMRQSQTSELAIVLSYFLVILGIGYYFKDHRSGEEY